MHYISRFVATILYKGVVYESHNFPIENNQYWNRVADVVHKFCETYTTLVKSCITFN